MRALAVGELFHPDQVLWPEGAVYTVTPEGHNLALFVDEPTESHATDVASGEAELGVYGDGAIVLLLYRFGESLAWSDAPLHWGRVRPAGAAAPQLAVALVDGFSGVVRALRAEALPFHFAEAAAAVVANAMANPWPGDAEYDQLLRDLYAAASSEELAAGTAVTCRLAARGGPPDS